MLLRLGYILLQWTWGLPQSLLGLALLLFLGRQRRAWYRLALLTAFERGRFPFAQAGGVSLGMFIFAAQGKGGRPDPGLVAHEYGHTLQSLLLGPLYLPLVGLPSVLWLLRYGRRRADYAARGVAYTDRYPENWAERWGGQARLWGKRP